MLGNMNVYFQITVKDSKTGKTIRKTRRRRSRSFVLQFLQLLEVSLRHAFGVAGDIIATLDTGNVARSMYVSITIDSHSILSADAVEDDDTYGLVVGSDNTAEANTDYKIITQIADGSAAGELDYSAHTFVTSAVVGANVDLQIQRPFINNSGGNVTIEECGLYLKSATVGGNYIFCVIRDITGSVVVADGQTATVDYTFRTTV